VQEQVFGVLPLGVSYFDFSRLNQGLYTYGMRTNARFLTCGEFAK
jgi:hypothetical protein